MCQGLIMINSKIYSLFPIPLYQSNLNRKFTVKEKNFFNDCLKNYQLSEGNFSSVESYVLNNSILDNLKKQINLRITDYFNTIIQTQDKINLYITQSWISGSKEGQYHHKHKHGNSILSGVLYIEAEENIDQIMFHNERDTLFFGKQDYNLFNSQSWFFPVKTGDIIIFPSYLEHSVPIKKTSSLRVSLSFNTFIKGTLGSKHQKTKLIIK